MSLFETVYHGVPVISMPVFCDHDINTAKAELDGYALVLDLSQISVDTLLSSINKVINDPKYRKAVKKRQILLKDQKETALERAVYWTEYVIRHKGAIHLQSISKEMNWIEYYMIDVFICLFILFLLSSLAGLLALYAFYNYLKRSGIELSDEKQKKEKVS